MHCENCGATHAGGAQFCISCGKPLHAGASAPGSVAAVAAEGISYAGFWERLAALILDSLLGLCMTGVFEVLWSVLAAGDDSSTPPGLLNYLPMLLPWLTLGAYFILMESSERGATLGKRALKLRVVDGDGQRISKGRALVRLLGRILSNSALYIGYLIQPFNARKQALHDMLAGTLVVRTGPSTKRRAIGIIVTTILLILVSLLYLIVHWILPAIGQGQLD